MNILEKIALNKRMEVDLLKAEFPLSLIRKKLPDLKPFRLSDALSQDDSIHIIAEIKKGSPSKGIIAEDFNPELLAQLYHDGGATALSVLTESKFFYGHYNNIKIASEKTSLPVLCKDFMLEPYQIYHAKYIHADAILLIVKLLSKEILSNMLQTADDLSMDALVEVHDEDELHIALEVDAKIIGVNNRNLTTFETDLQTSVKLAKFIPDDKIKIAESGLFSYDDILLLQKAGYNNFLIGEALVKDKNPTELLKRLRGV